jgi:sterol desaturase/sphingolipid hydroxylase (fatty acid hydroxylase superfamily)
MAHLFGLHLPPFLLEILRVSLWLAILVAVFVPLERVFAVHPKKIFRKGLGTDLGYYFLSSLLTALLLSGPVGILAWAAHRIVPAAFLAFTAALPFWARLVAGFVVGEVGYYWSHRWSHQFPFLWRFHSIHHSAEHVDFLVSSRAHPFDMVFGRFCGLVPIYVLGLAGTGGAQGSEVPIVLGLIAFAWGFFIHADLRWRFGPLEWLISTPANRNYASTLPWVDWIFGTYYLPRSEWPVAYGTDEPVPDSLVGQLAYPLRTQFPEAVAAARQSPVQEAVGGAVPQGQQVNGAAGPVVSAAPCLAVQRSEPEFGGEKMGDAPGKQDCIIR